MKRRRRSLSPRIRHLALTYAGVLTWRKTFGLLDFEDFTDRRGRVVARFDTRLRNPRSYVPPPVT